MAKSAARRRFPPQRRVHRSRLGTPRALPPGRGLVHDRSPVGPSPIRRRGCQPGERPQVTNKPQVLHLARGLGFDVPPTLVTNDAGLLTCELDRRELIVKPVNGGDFARDLREVLPGAARWTALWPPRRSSSAGWCRRRSASTGSAAVLPLSTGGRRARLPLHRGLPGRPPGGPGPAGGVDRPPRRADGPAADGLPAPPTSRPARRPGACSSWSINNSPMFAAFDAVSGGRLTGALADFLRGR